ncbi:hypothetical protein ACRFA2_22130 [Bacteroides hominis]|uniref:hypothetical protein n=1 Tax=Bacteroides hominis TaxID=2763023 RepID=UPI003D6D33C1
MTTIKNAYGTQKSMIFANALKSSSCCDIICFALVATISPQGTVQRRAYITPYFTAHEAGLDVG